MPVPFEGNINGTVLSETYSLPFKIIFFTITNKEAATITVNVNVTDGMQDLSVVPLDLQLSEGDMLQGDNNRIMQAGSQIEVITSGSADYYFELENIIPE